MAFDFLNDLKTVQHGTPNEIEAFVHSDNWFIRLQVAEHGTDEQRQQLIDDPNQSVRASVAICGSDTQMHTLLSDDEPFVRQSALRNAHATVQDLINALHDKAKTVVEHASDELEIRNVTLPALNKKG